MKKKLNGLSENMEVLSTKNYNFLLGRTYFTGDDRYQNFLAFA